MHSIIVLASEKPNGVILPADINEVIWGSIAFFIVMALVIWKGGPAIKTMWNGRIERISGELDSAQAARTQAEADLAEVQGRIATADQERARIRSEAEQTAAAVEGQILAKADSDALEMAGRTAADIEASKSQATADLQSEIGVLALGAAEEVVTRNLDAATQNQLIESYISSIGTQGAPA